MRVRIKEKVIKHGNPPFPHQDDEITVDDATGSYWCNMGWATDLAGKIADVEPDRNVTHGLVVPPATHGVADTQP